MANRKEHYRKIPVEPIEPLILRKADGKVIQVNAIGYGIVKPCIDIVQNSLTPTLRTRTESIAFADTDFDLLYEFLTKVNKHWERG